MRRVNYTEIGVEGARIDMDGAPSANVVHSCSEFPTSWFMSPATTAALVQMVDIIDAKMYTDVQREHSPTRLVCQEIDKILGCRRSVRPSLDHPRRRWPSIS